MNLESPAEPPEPSCPKCGKAPALCVCDGIASFSNRVFVLFLQHPQEQDRDLGTAQLARLHFQNAEVKAGLSWPNLTKAVGHTADPLRWAVLYLGPAAAKERASPAPDQPLSVIGRAGHALDGPACSKILSDLEGIILLDGSWSQAKTLWWRNPWLLKCWRIVLSPSQPSLYGSTRREPRRESLSTLEAAALVMAELEGDPEIRSRLFSSFRRLLQQYRSLQRPSPATQRPKQPGKRPAAQRFRH